MSDTRAPATVSSRWSGSKDSTFEAITIPEELGPIQVDVTEQLVKQYAFCMDDYRDWHFTTSPFGSPVAHASLLANDLLTVYYTNYDRTTVSGLHTEEELSFLRPVPVGTSVTVTGRFVDKYERRGNGYVVMEAEARDSDGNVLVQHRGIEIMRVEPGPVVGRGAATPEKPIVPETADVGEASRPRPGLAVDTPVPGLSKHLTQEQMSVYSFVGEHEKNFHNDLDLARAGGMDNTIAQGMQSAGYFSELCTNFFGADWFTSGWLKAKFIKPVYPYSTIRVQGKVADQDDVSGGLRSQLHLWAHDHNARLISVGWAEAITSDDG